jgi:DNA-binding NtrC family response regulator
VTLAATTRRAIYLAVTEDGPAPDLTDFESPGWQLARAAGITALRRMLRQTQMQTVGVLDLRGRPTEEALSGLPEALRAGPAAWLALVDAEQLADPAIRQLIGGCCFDYLTPPCPPGMLATLAGHALGMSSLSMPSLGLPATLPEGERAGADGMIGRCPAMQALWRALRRAALSQAPVFVAGETGTGKELAAQAIHRHSARHERPFVAINCGAIAPSLVQSELFGYERGAFTGAQQRKIGRIEHANGGTLFLDEIGDLPLDCQAALLRFLQEGSFERVGGHEPIRLDVRIISATHQPLEDLIASGRFRADLYHRLCVLRLLQPPLRERGEDIALLAQQALRRYAGEAARRIHGFSPCAMRAMHRYAWPGNVRELLNRVRQAVVMADGRLITADDLGLAVDVETLPAITLEQARCAAEAEAVRRALRNNGQRMADAARELGISRVTLYRLIERHGLRGEHEPAAHETGAAADASRGAA